MTTGTTRLTDIGMFINVVMGTIHYCVIDFAGHPEKDPDGNMEFEEMDYPRSQKVLDVINGAFKTEFKMRYFYPLDPEYTNRR